MKVEDFDFELPEERIAQTPIEKRDHSRLMVLNREDGSIEHKRFYDIIDYLAPGDTLVLNDTRVMPARLIGTKEDTGATIEVLLLKQKEKDHWEALCKPAKRVKQGTVISFGNGELKAKCVKILEEGLREFELIYDGIFLEVLETLGQMPLPPYISEQLANRERYQTVFSKVVGSAAAPTAGLHFTEELLKQLKEKGVHLAYLTLHVGLGTFRPVAVDRIEDHKMHAEFYMVSQETAERLNETRRQGKRIISVGTTTTRTLETIRQKYQDEFKEDSGWTDIFIYPGFQFRAIDGLITNFHLPKSTLIMLVSAFASREAILHAYDVAVKENYRFFSFGDAMFIR